MTTRRERYFGCLLGLAAGDALGTTLEFNRPGSFEPITDMTGGGPFGLVAGEWTDDTSMALCLAESLVETGGFDAADQIKRYCRWWHEGHLSSNGRCFDIGNTVRNALLKFEQTGEPYAGSTDPRTAGNGSLMRLAPVPMAYARSVDKAMRMAGESSKTTHGAPEAVDACRYYAALIVGALDGQSKEELLGPGYDAGLGLWSEAALSGKVAAIAAGSFKQKSPSDGIRGTGYVVDALEAALWAFHTTETFADGALAAANLGDDADTTAAIYGQLAGAYYGVAGIPAHWLKLLAQSDLIEDFADRLLDFAATSAHPARER